MSRLSSNLLFGGSMALLFGSEFMFTVYPGERAIVFNKLRGGISDSVFKEGLHFRIPWVQEVIKYDIRLRVDEFSTYTNTKDLQKVQLHLRILHKYAINLIFWIFLIFFIPGFLPFLTTNDLL